MKTAAGILGTFLSLYSHIAEESCLLIMVTVVVFCFCFLIVNYKAWAQATAEDIQVHQ